MISGYTNLNTLIAKVYRTLQNNDEVNFNDCAEWAAEALGLIGAFGQYTQQTSCLELVNGKAKLPLNLHKLSDIRYNHQPVYWSNNSSATNYGCSNCQIPICNDNNCQYTFYINNSYLISNIMDNPANICITYLGIPVDEDGIPLIPDDTLYHKAVESFIIHNLDYASWRKGKITDKVFEKSEQNWLWYVNAARGAGNMPNLAQLESLGNIMTRLMPLKNEYARSFRNNGKRENLNL